MADRKAAFKASRTVCSFQAEAKQRAMLQELVEEYAQQSAGAIAQDRMDRMKKAGNNLYFVWAGGENKGEPHYYRVAGPDFLIEYDNTQNNANHIHSVWRDLPAISAQTY